MILFIIIIPVDLFDNILDLSEMGFCFFEGLVLSSDFLFFTIAPANSLLCVFLVL